MKTLVYILQVFEDLIILTSPFNRKKTAYKFAFIVHPRNRRDIERKFPFFKFLPNHLVDLFTRYCWPITVSRVKGLRSIKNGEEIEGYIISILPTARQMVEDRQLAIRRITQACILAQKRGVKIVGLGGLTSSFSKGGLDLLDKVKLNITTGHAYTSYNVVQNVYSLTEYMGLNKKEIRVAIVGAAGSVGSTTAKLLAREGYRNLILIDLERKLHMCADVIKEIRNINGEVHVEASHQIKDIRIADMIVAATNAPEALIQSKDLKWGAIVIDDAQPSDVHQDVFTRKDVLVIEAGVTNTPEIKNNFNFGLKNKHDNFCCLAEVLILAAQEWNQHYVINRASLELVDKIAESGNRLSFRIGDYQNFNELISQEKLSFVRECIKQNDAAI